jgi:hypothetical protein
VLFIDEHVDEREKEAYVPGGPPRPAARRRDAAGVGFGVGAAVARLVARAYRRTQPVVRSPHIRQPQNAPVVTVGDGALTGPFGGR